MREISRRIKGKLRDVSRVFVGVAVTLAGICAAIAFFLLIVYLVNLAVTALR